MNGSLHSFFDEMDKISNVGTVAPKQADNKITRKKIKKFLRVGAIGAAGAGAGYGVAQLAGRPLERALLKSDLVRRNPARAAKYGLGALAALGTISGLSRLAMGQKMVEEVKR